MSRQNKSDISFDESDNLSVWWRYAVIIVMIVSFSILGFITSLAYENAPPIPDKVIDNKNNVLFTKENIQQGQSAFLKYNLMEHGTLWGHGAYLGPDYTAEYLHQEALSIIDYLAKKKSGKSFAELPKEQQFGIQEQTASLLKQNRFDFDKNILVYTPEELEAFDQALTYWTAYFTEGLAPGLPKNYIQNPDDLRNLITFFSWTSWSAVTNRPNENCTYTNNFPYDPMIGNYPCADAYFWSAMSLIFLLGAIGLMLFLFGTFDFLGWGSKQKFQHVHETHLKIASLSDGQRALMPYFVIVAILFLLQTLFGGLVPNHKNSHG